MITRDPTAFLDFVRTLAPDFGPATARAAFMVAPDGFELAEQSAADNRYMAQASAFDAERASQQHRALQKLRKSQTMVHLLLMCSLHY